MLNTYYLTDPATFQQNIDLFHPSYGAHCITLPNGKLLVSAHFPENGGSIEVWEANPNVITLPHPVFQGTQALTQAQIAALSNLGVKAGMTILNVASLVAAVHPLMKLRGN